MNFLGLPLFLLGSSFCSIASISFCIILLSSDLSTSLSVSNCPNVNVKLVLLVSWLSNNTSSLSLSCESSSLLSSPVIPNEGSESSLLFSSDPVSSSPWLSSSVSFSEDSVSSVCSSVSSLLLSVSESSLTSESSLFSSSDPVSYTSPSSYFLLSSFYSTSF